MLCSSITSFASAAAISTLGNFDAIAGSVGLLLRCELLGMGDGPGDEDPDYFHDRDDVEFGSDEDDYQSLAQDLSLV